MGELDENAGTIAGLWVSAGRAAVSEAIQDLEPLQYQFVGGGAFDITDEPNPARIMLESRIVQALLAG